MITSTSNPQVKNLQQLGRKAKIRNEQDVFLVEGTKMYLEAPAERIRKVYLSKSLYEEKRESFVKGHDVEILEDRVFAAACDTKTPQGVLCLENLQDPGNLGTILRTAEGAGVDGVILSKESVDIYNPKTIRSTMGSVYRLPFLYVDSIESILPVLKKHHVHTYAAHLKGKNSYEQENYCGGTAFFIGNEGNGLTDHLSSQADTLIRIPMEGKLESLNAAVASAILMYESYRQRRNA